MTKYHSLDHRLASLRGDSSASPGARFATTTLLFCLVAAVSWMWFPTVLRPSGLFAGWCGVGVTYFAKHKGFHWRSSSVWQRALLVAAVSIAAVVGGSLAMAVGALN